MLHGVRKGVPFQIKHELFSVDADLLRTRDNTLRRQIVAVSEQSFVHFPKAPQRASSFDSLGGELCQRMRVS